MQNAGRLQVNKPSELFHYNRGKVYSVYFVCTLAACIHCRLSHWRSLCLFYRLFGLPLSHFFRCRLKIITGQRPKSSTRRTEAVCRQFPASDTVTPPSVLLLPYPPTTCTNKLLPLDILVVTIVNSRHHLYRQESPQLPVPGWATR
jgi:hypothetical protein